MPNGASRNWIRFLITFERYDTIRKVALVDPPLPVLHRKTADETAGSLCVVKAPSKTEQLPWSLCAQQWQL